MNKFKNDLLLIETALIGSLGYYPQTVDGEACVRRTLEALAVLRHIEDVSPDSSHPQFVAGFKEGHAKGRMRGLAQSAEPLGGEDHNPLSVFAKECTLGAYSLDEVSQAALLALARARKEPEGLIENPWKEAVIDELVCCGIYRQAHDMDPNLAIKEAIDWNVQISLDPCVSSAARALVEQGCPPVSSEKQTVFQRFKNLFS